MEAMLWRLPPPTPGVLCLAAAAVDYVFFGRLRRAFLAWSEPLECPFEAVQDYGDAPTTGEEPEVPKQVTLPSWAGAPQWPKIDGDGLLGVGQLGALWSAVKSAHRWERRTELGRGLGQLVALLQSDDAISSGSREEFATAMLSAPSELGLAVVLAEDVLQAVRRGTAHKAVVLHPQWCELLRVVLQSGCAPPGDVLRRLWLCALWLPPEVAGTVVALLAQAEDQQVVSTLRFAALCHSHPSVSASLQVVLDRLPHAPVSVERLDDLAAATPLVYPSEHSADEVGGAGAGATLGRLQFEARVRRLREGFVCLWNALPITVPASCLRYDRKTREARLQRCRVCKLQGGREANREISALMMGTEASFFGEVLDSGLFDATKAFTSRAREYDPTLPQIDVFQAARNCWTCFAVQLLFFPQHVGVNSAVFGYSMLYPYSDNYLDDTRLSAAVKREFQGRFRSWLCGSEAQRPINSAEAHVFNQVKFIESEIGRGQPYANDAYNSLVAILDAQTASLRQHCPPPQPVPTFQEMLDITVYKGGTSVMADVYMSRAQETDADAELFGFLLGTALQFVDDIQDAVSDRRHHHHTIFTVAMCAAEACDPHINRLLHMIDISLHNRFRQGDSATVRNRRQQILYMCNSMVLKSVIKSRHLFTPGYLSDMEEYAPLPFTSLVKVNSMRHLLDLVDKDEI